MVINRFEDIIAWQKSKQLTLLVYKSLEKNRDYSFKDQIQRAAVSVMNNIAEGFERGSNQELKRFLFISKGSCAEVRSLLYVGLELKYFFEQEFTAMSNLSLEISKMLSSFIKKL